MMKFISNTSTSKHHARPHFYVVTTLSQRKLKYRTLPKAKLFPRHHSGRCEIRCQCLVANISAIKLVIFVSIQNESIDLIWWCSIICSGETEYSGQKSSNPEECSEDVLSVISKEVGVVGTVTSIKMEEKREENNNGQERNNL